MMSAVLIRRLTLVASMSVAAHQILEFTLITDGGRATDIGRGPHCIHQYNIIIRLTQMAVYELS